jgi:hypothetical protein
LLIVQVDPEGDDDDEAGADIPVTQDSVRALVTQMAKNYTCSAVFKDYIVSARALMTAARFHREKEEDIEEAPDDE